MPGPTKPAIQVDGAKELRRALTQLGARASDFTAIHRELADKVAGEARGRAPLGPTGRLRRSVKTRASKTRASVIAGGGQILYAGVIHFGWPRHNIEPQPFLYRALDARKDEVVRRYERRVDELVTRLDRETPG